MAAEMTRAPKDRVMDICVTFRLIDSAIGQSGSQQMRGKLALEIEELASELAGPAPSPVQKNLAETAAIAWFALRLFESQFIGESNSGEPMSLEQSEFHQRRIDRAHRRYLATLKTLATVRKLALPTMQINVARQQVNVAGRVEDASIPPPHKS